VSFSRTSALTRFGSQPTEFPQQLEIESRNGGDVVTLTVRGEVDLASARALERDLRDAECTARRIVLDLAGVEFIDCIGIHVLMDAQARAQSNGHELILTHLPAHAERLFKLTGIDARITIE
jgi:anti-sigma B factor antagonist